MTTSATPVAAGRSRSIHLVTSALVLLLVASGCTQAGAGPGSTGAPRRTLAASPATQPSPLAEEPTPSGSGPIPMTSGSVTLDQAWATAPLVDVGTGATFRIADMAGQVVVIETMAIWCSKCLAQQQIVDEALASLPAGSVTYVVLDVDPNEDGSSLAAYQAKHGLDGRYAVAGTDVARALAAEFGDQVLNPPSTPIVVIGTDGRVTLTAFGQKSAAEIVALAKAHGA